MSMWNAPERGDTYLTESQSIEMDQIERRGPIQSSKRLTPKWTKTTTEAFGDTQSVRNGNLAEEMIFNDFTKIYDFAQRNESDRQLQLEDKDITFGWNRWARPYYAGVKYNGSSKDFRIKIEDLLESQADRWVHANPTTGWYAMYDRKVMIEHIKKLGKLKETYVSISTQKGERPDFVEVKKAK